MAPSRPMRATSASAPESISAPRRAEVCSNCPDGPGHLPWAVVVRRTCRVQHPLTDISTALDNGQRSPFGGTEWLTRP